MGWGRGFFAFLGPPPLTGIAPEKGGGGFRRSSTHKIGWQVTLIFQVCIHKKDLHLLKAIQCFFNGAGIIREMKDDLVILMVRSLDEITNIIIPHFDKYPLLTQKYADYLLFKQVAAMMGQKEHLTQGVFFLEKIVSIKASVNLGLPDSLKASFPDAKLARRHINPVPRPEIDVQLLKALNSD